ncbi:thiamine pyrophosphate-binding protein [Ramlibacter sp. AW1]|uniref:Thiamine pyrophosphate-binding protein n=1 Tax=Ramlibacter aurantiacus TaxID=2801330 RepID=A0A937D4T3_9BURK|nr:thiamine pyrophosphate-binding protein [Ramlibacter aurantiacus]MBL0420637.1 thiamine pyrophosphate-binding protein [Ramlibacter aurantiacus]
MTNPAENRITVGELAARFLESCGVRAAFGVISIHNMPILDAFHRRQKIRFVSSRGEAGACNMADAYARVTGTLGAFVTSTGTGAGNAAGAMVEALTAGTPLLHLTGQIESPFLDRDLGYIHEHPAQLAMLQSVGKAAFRIRNAETALATLREAHRLAFTAPCGPVSIEIPIDIQKQLMDLPEDLHPLPVRPVQPEPGGVQALADRLAKAKRPMLWLGGGARGARGAVERFVKMGWGVVTTVQGRGIVPEDHPACLGSYNLQPPSEKLYQTCDAMLVVGSRLRSNETLSYKLKLPQPLYRIDANPLAHNRGYTSDYFVQGDAEATLNALADLLEGRMNVDTALVEDVQKARAQAAASLEDALGAYATLKNEVGAQLGKAIWWVRDITLSNSMWGNRAPVLDHPRAGVHALGGGIGQGLAMGIGTAVANAEHELGRRTVVLSGDGGFMLNVGELACAVQEKADFTLILMNDRRYGVIRNIQDDIYGSRHAYVDLHTPDFAAFCASLGVKHLLLEKPADTAAVLQQAAGLRGPVVVEVDMNAWGPFQAKFAGPILKKD